MDPNCLDNTIDPENIRPFEDEGTRWSKGPCRPTK